MINIGRERAHRLSEIARRKPQSTTLVERHEHVQQLVPADLVERMDALAARMDALERESSAHRTMLEGALQATLDTLEKRLKAMVQDRPSSANDAVLPGISDILSIMEKLNKKVGELEKQVAVAGDQIAITLADGERITMADIADRLGNVEVYIQEHHDTSPMSEALRTALDVMAALNTKQEHALQEIEQNRAMIGRVGERLKGAFALMDDFANINQELARVIRG